MKRLLLFLPFLLAACDKKDAIVARSALVGFLISLTLLTIVIPTLARVFSFKPLQVFLESISRWVYLATFWIGMILTGSGVFSWLNSGYLSEPWAISILIIGIGTVVGSLYLKKWHEGIEEREYLTSFVKILVLAVAVVLAIQVLIN